MVALYFMVFSLFLSGGYYLSSIYSDVGRKCSYWFMLTGVGLPVIVVIVLVSSGGELREITSPVGRIVGNSLIIVCYLCIGPLFASSRMATISYVLDIIPFTEHDDAVLYIHSFIYLSVVAMISLYPSRLI
jgi:LIVCS family branched-chain amino acid:cation transporter